MGRLYPPTAFLDSLDRAGLHSEAILRGSANDGAVLRHRAILIVAMAATVFIVLAARLFWGPPATVLEPDLQRLLHGMVAIKGLIGLASAALVFWRLGGPVARPIAFGYIAAVCVSLGAVVWLWGLWAIPLGSLLFWSGLAGIALVARRDRLIGEMARRARIPSNRLEPDGSS